MAKNLYFSTFWIKLLLAALLIVLGVASFMYNQFLIQKIMEHERENVELWAKALEFNSRPIHQIKSMNLNSAIRQLKEIPQVSDSLIKMIEEAEAAVSSEEFVWDELVIPERFNIPSILVNDDNEIAGSRNIDEKDLSIEKAMEFSKLHEPIEISYETESGNLRQLIYYGESPTVQYLKYFPYIQIGLLVMLLGIGYTTYRSITRSEQSNLWVGMAKEAAHQLGTPLSSMYGWIQLLKEKHKDDDSTSDIVYEIEKDITRLRGVAERFNKIGSKPELKKVRLEPIVEQVISYMERRLPQLGKSVDIQRSISSTVKANINAELFQWAIENLVKNAMDAIRDNSNGAFLAIRVQEADDKVIIDVEDSGSGIDRKNFKDVFKPGFSTKKRGWGLGLSLTRRIIEEYHKGKIFIHASEPNKGTTVRIILKR
ncbi:MAG: PAS domain-containing sensor histidine kinase [Balneolaceae bacterium]